MTITASVVPIRTEPAPARLKLEREVEGSIRAPAYQSRPDFVTAEIQLLCGFPADFVRSSGGASRPRSRLRHERRNHLGRPATARRALSAPRVGAARVSARPSD